MEKSKVYLVSTDDRAEGTRRCVNFAPLPDYSGKTVFVKPNFNTADEPPGSSHMDTVEALFEAIRAKGPAKLILGERSGPAMAAEVFRIKGIGKLCSKYGAELINFEELPPEGWVVFEHPDFHWPEGTLKAPRAFLDADAVITTCCLKTHGFGGVFSNSLKLSVGVVPKDFKLLHNTPDMRKMIAEINLMYSPQLVVVDAVEVFTDGGPADGLRKRVNLMLAGNDRVALDAVGLAILINAGSNNDIMNTPIFRQEQMARAVELGIGVPSADMIEIVTDDEESEKAAAVIREVLKKHA